MTTALRERLFWDGLASEVGAGPAAYREETDEAEWLRVLRSCGLPENGRLLDLGCGAGRLTWYAEWMSDDPHPCTVVGVDSSMEMLNEAERTGATVYVQNDGRTIPIPDAFFDGGWSVLLFQHLGPPAIHGYLNELWRVLRPGAPFVIQWVLGDTRNPLAYKYDVQWMAAAARGAGLTIKGYWPGLILDEWGWMTVARP